MNSFSNIAESGLLKNDYGAPKNATEAALKKRREALYKTRNIQEPTQEEIIDESEDE